MSKNIIVGIVVVIAAAVAYMFYKSPASTVAPVDTTSVATTTDTSAPAATTTTAAPAAVKFADQDYFKMAYEIDPLNLVKMNAETKQASMVLRSPQRRMQTLR